MANTFALMSVHTAYLCIGGNLGDRLANLEETRMFITFNMGDIVSASSVYESPAWGMDNAPSFLNQVVKIETKLTAQELMTEIEELEEFYGRKRKPGEYTSRQMDVDILFFDDMVTESESLHIPHARLHLRKFVLVPMNEIAPEFVHPSLKKTISQLLLDCPDSSRPVLSEQVS